MIEDPNAGALLVSEDYPRSAVVGSRRTVRCHRPALFTRCRCQPEGLLWNSWRPLDGGHWDLCTDLGHTSRIAPYHAIDLILMSIARDATAAKGQMTRCKAGTWGDRSSTYSHITTAVMSGDLPGAVAARHRLKDLEEQT